jgi:hypothetical protein
MASLDVYIQFFFIVIYMASSCRAPEAIEKAGGSGGTSEFIQT